MNENNSINNNNINNNNKSYSGDEINLFNSVILSLMTINSDNVTNETRLNATNFIEQFRSNDICVNGIK